MKREIILDTETTGLDPTNGHRLIEIGCVEVIDAIRTGQVFHRYLNPERHVPAEAERVHGINTDFLLNKPIFAQVVDNFLAFIADSTLVIHNAAFDMKFINSELGMLGFKPISMERTLDTVLLARKKFPGAPASLDALCKRFNIDLGGRIKHGALLDAELLADVYLELQGGRQTALGLSANDSQPLTNTAVQTTGEFIPPRDFSPSEAELDAHAAMVKRLKNPVWESA